MDRDFKLGTELTEEDVGGDRHISARQASAVGSSGLNLNAATNGGWGLVVGALALWAVWWLFPGNQRQPPLPQCKRTVRRTMFVCPPARSERMSHDAAAHDAQPQINPDDAAEAVVPVIPIVLPLVGAVMMFLLAFIAVNMA